MSEEGMMGELCLAYAYDEWVLCEGCKEFKLSSRKNPATLDSATHLRSSVLLNTHLTWIVNTTNYRGHVSAQKYNICVALLHPYIVSILELARSG